MLGAIEYEDIGGIVRVLEIRELDRKTVLRARKRFEDYQDLGVVCNDSFDDDVWVLQSDIETVRLKFRYDKEVYEKRASLWTACSFGDYVECAKAFAAFCLGSVVLPSIRAAIKITRDIIYVLPDASVLSSDRSAVAGAFLSLLPGRDMARDGIIQALEECTKRSSGKRPRGLIPFRDYIDFHNRMIDFWSTADESDRYYYFPVYLWWTLTTILPLRPTEFLLIPRDCLTLQNGADILTVRRTRMKKQHRKVSYRIQKDYQEYHYEIPGWMAREIRAYQSVTESKDPSSVGTLFIPTGPRSYFFNYDAMRLRLLEFCRETGYGGNIHLGDTRHLAMINLILSGGSPSMCRELAGHESIDVSSNYYANLSQIIREAAYDYCHRNGGGAAVYGKMFYPVSVPERCSRVSNGWCSAPEMLEGRIDACLRTFSSDGGIGDCRKCICFYPDDPGVWLEMENEREAAVDADSVFLMDAIEKVRKGTGSEETIRAALSRLQNDSRGYGALLCRKYRKEKDG